jgi:hypothetical protein
MDRTMEKIWVVNKSDRPFEKTSLELKKHLIFKPFIPMQMQKLNQLIIRDAGIGDLLMLEPVLRQLVKDNKRVISILSRYPEVFYYHPSIHSNFRQEHKNNIPKNVRLSAFDAWEDLRGYSETCTNRDKICRTDCYNQVFGVNMDDPEPRIYMCDRDKPVLKKKKGMIYIGLACDGSHSYRRYDKGAELIQFILGSNPKYVVVLLGAEHFVKYQTNKRVMDLQGKTTVRDCFNVVKDLDYMISVDTGILHVALSMHVPSVCIFSIIRPELRLHYYKGPKQVVYKDKNLSCIGCGSFHMAVCKHGNKSKDPQFIAPCLDIPPEEIVEKMQMMPLSPKRRTFAGDRKRVETAEVAFRKIIKNAPQNRSTLAIPNIMQRTRKLTMPIIVLNEERNLPRFIELVMKNPAIGRVIAIDGGSHDKTVEILKKAGAYVYVHPYDKNYHDMQAMQRNYSCSFVRDGEKIIIMDIDECFSPELSNYLPELCGNGVKHGIISRRTFNFYNDISDPKKQIKDYPDYQPRFFTWNRRYKWIGSPHHNVYNAPDPIRVNKDIIHFEKEGKDRVALERQWAAMSAKTRDIYK